MMSESMTIYAAFNRLAPHPTTSPATYHQVSIRSHKLNDLLDRVRRYGSTSLMQTRSFPSTIFASV